MPALTDRSKARQRLTAAFHQLLDKLIPADPSQPLHGGLFVEFEDQADEIERTLCPMYLEERVALEACASAECGGRCPYCSSDRVYLIKEAGKMEVLTPHGPVVLYKQRCRCRSCDRTFSPSAAGSGIAVGSGDLAEGGASDRAGVGVPEFLRQRGAGDQ